MGGRQFPRNRSSRKRKNPVPIVPVPVKESTIEATVASPLPTSVAEVNKLNIGDSIGLLAFIFTVLAVVLDFPVPAKALLLVASCVAIYLFA